MKRGRKRMYTKPKDNKRDTLRLTIDDMNPKRLNLHIGQELQLEIKKENGDTSIKKAVVKKFYKNHVLCRVNGRFSECFTYNQLSQYSKFRNGAAE